METYETRNSSIIYPVFVPVFPYNMQTCYLIHFNTAINKWGVLPPKKKYPDPELPASENVQIWMKFRNSNCIQDKLSIYVFIMFYIYISKWVLIAESQISKLWLKWGRFMRFLCSKNMYNLRNPWQKKTMIIKTSCFIVKTGT